MVSSLQGETDLFPAKEHYVFVCICVFIGDGPIFSVTKLVNIYDSQNLIMMFYNIK